MVGEEIKKKKKIWAKIVGAKDFKNNEIGESYVIDAKSLIGKKMKIGLANLTGDMRKQNVFIGFIISDVSGNQAKADVISYNVSNAHIRRMIRSGKDKLEHSFVSDVKDNKKIRVKILALTKAKTKNSVLSAIRKGVSNYFAELGKISGFDEIINKMVIGEIIKGLRAEIKKVYPLSVLEIKSVELVK